MREHSREGTDRIPTLNFFDIYHEIRLRFHWDDLNYPFLNLFYRCLLDLFLSLCL
jgi:hypothetical protein